MVGKELIVMEDIHPSDTLEEYKFSLVPIWVRPEDGTRDDE